MSAGTVFVLFLAAGFLALILYLHHLSQRATDRERELHLEERQHSDRSNEAPPRKRAS